MLSASYDRNLWLYRNKKFVGRAKANGREPTCYLGCGFHFKLGNFAVM